MSDLKRALRRLKFSQVVAFILVTIHVLIIILPFVWMVMSTFKTNQEFLKNVWALPSQWNLDNFKTAWGAGSLGKYTLNSLTVTLISVFMIVLIATLGGYGLGIYKCRWSQRMEVVMTLAMTIPAYVSLVPLVETLRRFSLLDTHLGLILPTIAFNIPISVFIMRSFFVTIPQEILDAAKIDGSNDFEVFFHIGLPLSKPSMFTTAIINVIWVWNDFLFPLVFINSPSKKTLPVGLKDYVGEHITNYPVMLSAILIASLGAFIIYLFFQKQVIGGLMGGAVKE